MMRVDIIEIEERNRIYLIKEEELSFRSSKPSRRFFFVFIPDLRPNL